MEAKSSSTMTLAEPACIVGVHEVSDHCISSNCLDTRTRVFQTLSEHTGRPRYFASAQGLRRLPIILHGPRQTTYECLHGHKS